MAEARSRGSRLRGHVLITHTHWDHIQAIPFFAPFFAAGHEWDIYAPRGRGLAAGNLVQADAVDLLPRHARSARRHDPVSRPSRGEFDIADVHVRTQPRTIRP